MDKMIDLLEKLETNENAMCALRSNIDLMVRIKLASLSDGNPVFNQSVRDKADTIIDKHLDIILSIVIGDNHA